MSLKTEAFRSVYAANHRLGGSISTRVQRKRNCEKFIIFCFHQKTPLRSIKAAKLDQVSAYFKNLNSSIFENLDNSKKNDDPARKEISLATLHNILGSIRNSMRVLGADPDKLGVTKKNLGLPSKSRSGRKVPITDESFEVALKEATQCREMGLVIALKLERFLGHRGQEALMSSHALKMFAVECNGLINNEVSPVAVISGTKGGRARQTVVIKKYAVETLETIADALKFTAKNGFLIKGKTPGLRSARAKYHALARKVGLVGSNSPHALRYRYCCDKLQELHDAGVPRAEALVLAAQYLGHGPARGRFVSQVYGQTIETSLSKSRRRQDYASAAGLVDRMLVDARRGASSEK